MIFTGSEVLITAHFVRDVTILQLDSFMHDIYIKGGRCAIRAPKTCLLINGIELFGSSKADQLVSRFTLCQLAFCFRRDYKMLSEKSASGTMPTCLGLCSKSKFF
jgi:hypothetical protein